MKQILISGCWECPYLEIWATFWKCGKNGNPTSGPISVSELTEIPSWCPLEDQV